jgi:hypothetical protein
MVYSMFAMWFYPFNKELTLVQGFGLCGFVLCGVIGFMFLTEAIQEKRNEARRNLTIKPRKPKQPNILVEYIKARKEKVCPRIDWID